jgi:hypothetical protein
VALAAAYSGVMNTAVRLRAFLVPAVLLSALTVSACVKRTEAPYDKGVCWHMIPLAGGKVKFNKLADNQQALENCAAKLEGMRERFLALGGNQSDIIGAYQGNFLFLGKTGVFTGTSLEGARWPALVRTQDGRLVVPGAVSQ